MDTNRYNEMIAIANDSFVNFKKQLLAMFPDAHVTDFFRAILTVLSFDVYGCAPDIKVAEDAIREGVSLGKEAFLEAMQGENAS